MSEPTFAIAVNWTRGDGVGTKSVSWSGFAHASESPDLVEQAGRIVDEAIAPDSLSVVMTVAVPSANGARHYDLDLTPLIR